MPSQFTSALLNRRINLAGDKVDDTHLYTALATCWRTVAAATATLVSTLRQLQTGGPDKLFEDEAVVQSLKTLIYAATEGFDQYSQTIPKRLEKGRGKSEIKAIRNYQNRVKRLRDPVAMMCNKMKHNHREIVVGRIVSELTQSTTFVYRINAAYGSVQRADAEVHPDGLFASFERTLHEIVHGMLRADHNAAVLVRNLTDNNDQPISLAGLTQLGLAKVIVDLASHIPVVAQSEPGRFDGIAIDSDVVLLTRIAAEKVSEPTLRTMHLRVDEVALSAELML